MVARKRIVKIILLILANPHTYTRKEIADKLGITKRNVDDDIVIIKDVLNFEQKKPAYTCAILPDKNLKELGALLPLNNEDRNTISNALNKYCASREKLYLNKKLDSLYNFQELGIRALRKPALEKIDRLNEAHDKKVCVILEDYYSNSSDPRDRKVEPFSVDAELDTLQAFDTEAMAIRHFKLNRIKRVQILTDQPWQYKDEHHKKDTDVFRIANDDQVMVDLELDIQGRNVLLDTFPGANVGISDASEKNMFHFQSNINADFYGITNFILGNSDNVHVIGPKSLKEHLQKKARKIITKYNH